MYVNLFLNIFDMSTLNNGARSNGRDEDEKKKIFVNAIS